MERKKLIGLISLVVAIILLVLTSLSLLGLYSLNDVLTDSSKDFPIVHYLFIIIRIVPLYFAYFSIKVFKQEKGFKFLNANLLLFFAILNILHLLISFFSQSYITFQYTPFGAYILVFLLVLYAASLLINSLFLVVKEERNFKNKPVLLVLLLTFLTFGVYGSIWFLRQWSVLKKHNSPKVPNINLIYAHLIVTILVFITTFPSEIASQLSLYNPIIDLSSWGFYFCHLILSILLSFQFKGALEQYFGKKKEFSSLATFVFVFYYLQYKINKLMK